MRTNQKAKKNYSLFIVKILRRAEKKNKSAKNLALSLLKILMTNVYIGTIGARKIYNDGDVDRRKKL
jgi:hypothetical protein